ncbi:acetyltransferase [Flavobacterium sp. LMO8]|uniref:acetyltransferase n=1 Tax=Flavobacterium sp. LMO8 TaxID=2654244 RepID=UPI001290B369|nr:acetyltransferase [Flavobacterium sp. LMO8]MQP24738.1 acetyltransferase [Flavobacterium sp. LMO8]
MKQIVIVGAGGLGREVKCLIDAINKVSPTYTLLGFYDDGFAKGTLINGLPVLGNILDLISQGSDLAVAVAIGTPKVKHKVVDLLKSKLFSYPVLIHPTVIISDDEVIIGQGTIICAGAILTCNIGIGDFVLLNLSCTVGHDTKLHDYSSFMPGVHISGEVIIESSVYVGTGATIINGVTVGRETIVGAGAVVVKSLPSCVTAVGTPAKPIKMH